MTRKKKSDGVDLTAKVNKREPAWKQLGYTPEYSPSGSRKGFRDKEGNYIPERQFRKLVGTPMKGSQGYKERQAAKKEGKSFRPMTEKQVHAEMKKAAKNPGMTLEEFMTGKSREIAYENRRTLEKHNEFIDNERRKAVEFKRMTGVMTDKQAEKALQEIQEQAQIRDRLQELADKLQQPLTAADRNATLKEFNKLQKENAKYQARLEKKGVVIIDDKEAGESLRYGYYH